MPSSHGGLGRFALEPLEFRLEVNVRNPTKLVDEVAALGVRGDVAPELAIEKLARQRRASFTSLIGRVVKDRISGRACAEDHHELFYAARVSHPRRITTSLRGPFTRSSPTSPSRGKPPSAVSMPPASAEPTPPDHPLYLRDHAGSREHTHSNIWSRPRGDR
jgi:hypothetical protein